MSKPKVAFYWCSSCGGCEEAVVDLNENILDVAAAIDIILWPVALDFKYKDMEAMEDGSIAVSFINGAIRTEEQEHIAKLLRKKSGLIVSFGSCSVSGGIPALANLTSKEKIFDASYFSAPTVINDEKLTPQTKCTVDGIDLKLPEFYETVYKLDDIIEVDYYLPGCAPNAQSIANAVNAILKGELPKKGTTLLPNKCLCDSCELNKTKPEDVCISEIKRVTEIQLDPETCFLAQGVICMGPATRDGCESPCIKGNMPCTGCFGPLDGCKDQGAKMISALGGLIAGEKEEEINAALKGAADPAGTFYRYAVSSSLLGNARKEDL